jgi:hypothetical protein
MFVEIYQKLSKISQYLPKSVIVRPPKPVAAFGKLTKICKIRSPGGEIVLTEAAFSA